MNAWNNVILLHSTKIFIPGNCNKLYLLSVDLGVQLFYLERNNMLNNKSKTDPLRAVSIFMRKCVVNTAVSAT